MKLTKKTGSSRTQKDVEEYFCIDAYEPDDGKGLYEEEYLASIQPARDVGRLVYLAEQIANLPEAE